MNCSLPSMETALVEKLHRTYMLAAMWKKEKWLKVERSIGEQSDSAGGQSKKHRLLTARSAPGVRGQGGDSLEAGLEVK